ncbi:MAG: chromate transporter [Bacteroidales bacterium]|nr:chromate transporter [Bacteroidales bacterium]
MIFWQLFYTFLKIGIFTFGGGYAMVALIQNEVVVENQWMTSQEFTDVLAISQATPGPLGINTATYAGYTAVVNAGYSAPMGVLGAFLASFSVILLPFVLMLIVTKILMKHKESKAITDIFTILRKVVVGLIAASALLLASTENFGSPTESTFRFVISILIFISVFVASYKFKKSPILLILVSGIIGFLVYGLPEMVSGF